jgi:hypothetical protein
MAGQSNSDHRRFPPDKEGRRISPPVPGAMTNRRNESLLILFLLAMTVKIAIAYFATDPIHFQKYPYFAQRVAQGVDIGERLLDLSPLYLYATIFFIKFSDRPGRRSRCSRPSWAA